MEKVDVTVKVSSPILISLPNTRPNCVLYCAKKSMPQCLIKDYRPSVIQATCNFLRVQNSTDIYKDVACKALLEVISTPAEMMLTEVTKDSQKFYIIKFYPSDPEKKLLGKLTITSEGIQLNITLPA